MILSDTTTNSDNPVYCVFWAGGLYLLNKFLFYYLTDEWKIETNHTVRLVLR